MRASLTDAHVRLLRGIRRALAADSLLAGWLDQPLDHRAEPQPAPCSGLVIENFHSEPWASLTFTGMRHRLDVRLCGAEGQVVAAHQRLKQVMDDPPLDLPGHFLAGIEVIDSLGEVDADGRMDLRVRIEALTIEE